MKTVWKNLAVAAVLVFVFFQLCHLIYPVKYEAAVEKAVAETGLDRNFVCAVIKAESGFNPDAVSESGAFGLMQLMPETASWICEKMGETYETAYLTDPEQNVRMGCAYLSYLLSMYHGNRENALAAYNAGHAHVDRWLEDAACSKDGETLDTIPFPETEKYVKRVTRYIRIYKSLYGEDER